MKSSEKALCERGFVDDGDVSKHVNLSIKDLSELLQSEHAEERSISAKIIGIKKYDVLIDHLVIALSKETKLYSKIAISEALGQLGTGVVKVLVPFLGKIGNNQYKTLPDRPFLKDNYPLPRDIVARTICKVGSVAIPILIGELGGNVEQLAEGIDAVGYISYYYCEHDHLNYVSARRYVFKLLDTHRSNPLIMWKLIRALQSFSDEMAIIYLKKTITETTIKQHEWEAKRSLKKSLNRPSCVRIG